MIDLTEVQSTILRPSAASAVELTFLTVCCRSRMRQLVTAAAEAVSVSSVAEERRKDGDHGAVNVGITAEGARLAGILSRTHDALPSAFTRGMGDATDRLVDEGPSAPEHWEWPFHGGEPRVHAVVLRYDGADLGVLAPFVADDEVPSCEHALPPPAVVAGGTSTRWCGELREGKEEAFGFRDGISDPVIEGAPNRLTPGNGVWDAEARAWRAVKAGEALLGHVDESGAVAGHPDAAHLERDGSYLVVRKLEQDAKGFHDACAEWAAELGTTQEAVEVQLVGRHHDGRVLGAEELGVDGNDFRFYDSGTARSTMAASSHVRRANPRDAVAMAAAVLPRHLLFRRAYPYAEKDPDGTVLREGLLFMACCADIRRQFEFVQAHWLQDGNRYGLGYERDSIVGTRRPPDDADGSDLGRDHVSVTDPSHPELRTHRRMASFVTTRGGEYFLLPSRSALRLLGDPRGC